jgi:hypothetical protein
MCKSDGRFQIAELDDDLRPLLVEVPVAVTLAELNPVSGGVGDWTAVMPRCRSRLCRTSNDANGLGEPATGVRLGF